jgi:hypothetical protein
MTYRLQTIFSAGKCVHISGISFFEIGTNGFLYVEFADPVTSAEIQLLEAAAVTFLNQYSAYVPFDSFTLSRM